ncbi:MAG: potassium channel protein [Planctomycetota bacterium]
MLLLRRIRRGLTFIAVFLVVAVGGHMWMADEGLLDSIYFVVITVSTVGYSETSEADADTKLFTIATILVGTTTVAYTVGLIVQAMIEGQIKQALGVQRMTREIRQLTGHAVICGYGRIGQTLAAEFELHNKPFVIVERRPEAVEDIQHEDRLVIAGDAADEDTLREAGIERADTFIVALPDDADNVFLTLTARNLNPRLRIIARGEQPATEKKLRQAGADQVVLPAVIGGRRMAAMVTRPHAAEMLEHFTNHEKLDADLEELTVTGASPLVGQTVRQAAARQKHHLLVVGVRREDATFIFNPDADTEFRVGDTLVVMGKRSDVREFQSVYGL